MLFQVSVPFTGTCCPFQRPAALFRDLLRTSNEWGLILWKPGRAPMISSLDREYDVAERQGCAFKSILKWIVARWGDLDEYCIIGCIEWRKLKGLVAISHCCTPECSKQYLYMLFEISATPATDHRISPKAECKTTKSVRSIFQWPDRLHWFTDSSATLATSFEDILSKGTTQCKGSYHYSCAQTKRPLPATGWNSGFWSAGMDWSSGRTTNGEYFSHFWIMYRTEWIKGLTHKFWLARIHVSRRDTRNIIHHGMSIMD